MSYTDVPGLHGPTISLVRSDSGGNMPAVTT